MPVLHDARASHTAGELTAGILVQTDPGTRRPRCDPTRRVIDLREIGACAHLYDASGDDLGFCHLPTPVVPGDLAANADGIFRVVAVVDELSPGAAIDLLAVVKPAHLVAVAR